MDHEDEKIPAIFKLERDNYLKWFTLVETTFEAKDIDYVLTQDQVTYSLVAEFGALNLDTESATPSSTTTTSFIPPPSSSKKVINVERQGKWKKDNAKAKIIILKALDDFDYEAVSELKAAKEIWEYLRKKYYDTRTSVGSSYLDELTGYRMADDGSIENAWIELKQIRAKLVRSKPEMAASFNEEEMFQRLLKALPPTYDTTRDAMDGLLTHSVDEKMRILRDKEDRLKTSTALMARGSYKSENRLDKGRRNHRKRSPSGSDNDSIPNRRACHICKQTSHLTSDCPFLSRAQDFAERQLSKSRNSTPSSSKSTNRQQKRRTELKKDARKGRKPRAYDAESDMESDEHDSESEISDQDEETAAVSKEAASKIPCSKWVADSGASSHMTDQLKLFSGPLIKIRRRIIRVGGGRLYADHIGDVLLKTGGRKVTLSNVYYVPGLGVNLLSGKKLCESGLRGQFDTRALRMLTKDGEVMVKATETGGVYIVNWISENINKMVALSAQITNIDLNERLAAKKSNLSAVGIHEVAMPAETIRTVDEGPKSCSDMQIDGPEAHPEAKSNDHSKDHSDDNMSGSDMHTYQLWHRRFAHLGHGILRHIHKVTTLAKAIPTPKQEHPCEVCALTKMRNKRNKVLSERKPELLDLISVDACGPLPPSLNGFCYFIEVVDNHSRKTWAIPIKSRDQIPDELTKWKIKVELQTGCRVRAVRSDNAPELKEVLTTWANNNGVVPELTVSYMSSQNGIAERAIQTSENSMRAMLKDSGLPLEFWELAVKADAYLRNRTAKGPDTGIKMTSPEEAWTGKVPSIDHIRVWGCKCYSYVDPKSLPASTRHDKLMDRGRVAVFVGYDEGTTKQYQIYAPDMHTVIKASVVKFNEDLKGGDIELKLPTLAHANRNTLKIMRPFWNGESNTVPDRKPRGRPPKNAQPVGAPDKRPIGASPQEEPALTKLPNSAQFDMSADDPVITLEKGTSKCDTHDTWKPEVKSTSDAGSKLPAGNVGREPGAESRCQVDPIGRQNVNSQDLVATRQFLHVEVPKRRRDDDNDDDAKEHVAKHIRALLAMIEQEERSESDVSCAYHVNDSARGMLAANADEDDFIDSDKRILLHQIPIPSTYDQAVADETHGGSWKNAIKAEVDALTANGTWEYVKPPRDANIVTNKWVFSVKYTTQGAIERYKARLVARGFSQVHGVDFTETFAPTMRLDTLRAFMAIVALEDLECHQSDISNAFTESELRETIYMSPPKGVNVPPGMVLHLRRSLYGLKQAARDWNFKMVNALVEMGFVQTQVDPCLFIHPMRQLILLLYVDDMIFAGKELHHISWFKSELAGVFKTKDLGETEKILGIEVTRDRKRRTVKLSQTRYIKKILESVGMTTSKHRPTSVPLNSEEYLRPAGAEDRRVDIKEYQKLIGSLMHAQVYTRPDIAFALGKLSQFMCDPAEHHLVGAKHLLRYMRSTANVGITFGPGPDKERNLHGFTDAAYADDKKDRKSTFGYIFKVAGGPISWASRKQKSVSTSTTEAEYVGLSVGARQSQWLTQLFREIGYPQYLGRNPYCADLRGDNQGSLALVQNPHLHERSKHIDVMYHHIRDLKNKDRIEVTYVPTDMMAADGLTKVLNPIKHKRFMGLLGMTSSGSYSTDK